MSNVDLIYGDLGEQYDPVTGTPTSVTAATNRAELAAVQAAAERAGAFYGGEDQARIDQIVQGAQTGVYAASDALSALQSLYANRPQGGGGGGGTTPTPPEPPTFTPRADARNTIRAVLSTFGLENLSEFLYDRYAREEVNIANPDAILFALRDTTEYKTRFAANARRAAKNLPELDPASYIALENQYRTILQSNGLDRGFYDSPSDFEKFIEGDVSPNELQSRISEGYRRVADADPEVKRQMKELYSVDEAGLAAYFLDPERAQPLLERRARAAQIAARAREQAGIQVGALTAEELASRGISPDQAQQGFAQMGRLAGLYQEMGSEQALTEQQKIGAAFGYDVQAQEQLARRAETRVAEFRAGGQFARTSGATSGAVETGAGTAQ